MKNFVKSHAGKGTIAVYLACLLVLWPPALSFLAATAAFVFAVREFHASFRQLDRERLKDQPFDAATAVNVAARGESRMPAVIVKERAADAATPVGQESLPDWLRLPA